MKGKDKSEKSKKAIQRILDRCQLCKKKGRIERGAFLFCCQGHADLYDKKIKDAEKRMKKFKTCSFCGEPAGKGKTTLIDCRIKRISDAFRPYVFCNEKCFDKWPG